MRRLVVTLDRHGVHWRVDRPDPLAFEALVGQRRREPVEARFRMALEAIRVAPPLAGLESAQRLADIALTGER